MKKRIASLGMAAVMLGASVPVLPMMTTTVSAEETEKTFEQLTYKIIDGKSVTITGCDKSAEEIQIPAEIEGMPVTTIDRQAFDLCRTLRSVTIPASVNSIAPMTFSTCDNLTAINVDPSNEKYESLNGVLFDKGQTQLMVFPCKNEQHDYTIPNTVSSISDGAFACAFAGGALLTSVAIPDSVTKIGHEAFAGCENLTDITIPEGVTSLDSTFWLCSSLKSVTIPDSITDIGGMAFSGCTSLSSVTIPKNVKSIGDCAFSNCSALTAVTIPDSVTSIGFSAFEYCLSLASVTIPDSVKSIGINAFDNCKALTIYGNAGSYAETYAKENNIPFALIATAAERTEKTLGQLTYKILGGKSVTITDCDKSVTEIEIPTEIDGLSVTSIGDGAFANCTELASVTLPARLRSIGISAFSNCKALKSIDLPYGLHVIGEEAFSGCSSLTLNDIPSSMNYLGASAFSGCSSLTSVEIPREIGIIAEHAFADCTALKSVFIASDKVDYDAFENCTSLTAVYISENTTMIRTDAFAGCKKMTIYGAAGSEAERYAKSNNIHFVLKTGTLDNGLEYEIHCADYAEITKCNSSAAQIEIPTEIEGLPVKFIYGNAFAGCDSLKSVTIPDSVKDIGQGAFCNCKSLESINLPDGLVSIDENTFSGCGSLTSINLPDSLESIGKNAFSGCGSLTTINLPDGLVSIDENTFSGCGSLTSIDLPDSLEFIGENAFSGCVFLTSVNIPDSVHWIETRAFSGCTKLTSINVDANNKTYVSMDGVLLIRQWAQLHTYPAGKEEQDYIVPSYVEYILDSAFDSCTSLKSVTIPDSLTSIEEDAFNGCSNLTISGYADSLAELYAIKHNMPFTRIDTGSEEDLKTLGMLKYEILNGKRVRIRECDKSAAEIKIPTEIDGLPVTSIGDGAFANCTALTSVSLPYTVDFIGVSAFSNCKSLKTINLPDYLKCIGNEAFSGCSSLPSADLSSSLQHLGIGAFSDCSSLTSVEIPHYIKTVPTNAFANCTALKYVFLPSGVTRIAEGAFGNCTALAAVTLTENVEAIENNALTGCDKLTIYGDAHSYTENYAKEHNIPFALRTGTLDNGLKYEVWTGSVTITGCDKSAAGELVIPAEIEGLPVTVLGESAFSDCDSVKSIIIPDSVEYISHAFWGCHSVESIVFPKEEPSWGEDTFCCDSLTSITISYSEKPDLDSRPISFIWGFAYSWSFGYCPKLSSIIAREDDENLASLDGILFNKDMTELLFCPWGKELQNYTIPDGVTSIAGLAFIRDEDESSPYSVIIPDSVTSIDDYAFSVPQLLTIYGNAGSYAETYAKEHNISFALIGSKPQAVPGDVNGDGTRNLKDVTLLRRYLAGGWENVTIDTVAADVNGDGSVNLKDVTILRRSIAGGWDVTL